MARVLLSWIGQHDLDAASADGAQGNGPLAEALLSRPFLEAHLLSDFSEEKTVVYLQWLRRQTTVPYRLHHVRLTSPVDYAEIHGAAVGAIQAVRAQHGPEVPLTFHLSPGTSAMTAVWVLLGKARYRAELIQSSKKTGVQTAHVPFDISAELIPGLFSASDQALERRSVALPPEGAQFGDIVYRSPVMQDVIDRAKKVAPRSVAVLLEGPSGTGKELLARAIHGASPRGNGPFVAVNCGALPDALAEAELFGNVKGAFTGALRERRGYFRSAHGGTLFLDEVGELPLPLQVKLLRVLQEREVTPLGSSRPEPIDVRVIAATNRALVEEVAAGRFREDLFYRLAVAVLRLPPLRSREGDLSLLIEHALSRIHQEAAREAGFEPRRLSPAAREVLLQHTWPGNVRELFNTLNRAVIWSAGPEILEAEIRAAMLPMRSRGDEDLLELPLGDGFSLPDLVARVSRHYLERALQEAGGVKTRAAALLGFRHYQTLDGWLERHGLQAAPTNGKAHHRT